MAALWTIFLLGIYVEGIPIVVASVALTNAFNMVFIQMPHVSPAVLYKPVFQGSLFGGAFYMLAMPHLSGFWELGSLLFMAVFGIAYVFYEAHAQLYRAMWMTMLVLIMGVDNQQTYSFLAFAQWFLVGLLFVSILVFVSRFPISFAAERQFNWQFRRFWHSAAFLLADLSATHVSGRFYRWRHDYHSRQLAALPSRLRVWSGALPPEVVDDEGRKRMANVVNSMQLFSFRMQDLQQVIPPAIRLRHVSSLRHEGDDMLRNLCSFIDVLAHNPGVFDVSGGRKMLEVAESGLEKKVREILQAGELTLEQGQLVYGALGAYRGLLTAVRETIDAMVLIDWQRLSEARF